jgi:hypothetical protein
VSLTARAVILALIVAAAVAGWWRLTAYYDNQGYQRAKAEDREAMLAQAERNRELQRAAEVRYTVQQGVRDHYIVKTIKEVRNATDPLAACPVPAPAIGLLNDAADCARGDSPSACGADESVRKP